jgi:hypothetical protein
MISSTMDDLDQHRKKRLELLIASPPYNGDRTAFIAKSKLTKGRISQLLDPKETFGELAAMRLAEKLGLPTRWFDEGASSSGEMWPFELLTPEQAKNLSPKALETVEKLALSLLDIEHMKENKGQPVVRTTSTNVRERLRQARTNGQDIRVSRGGKK